MTNGIHLLPGPGNGGVINNWNAVLTRLQGTLGALTELRRQLGLSQGSPGATPPLAKTMHDAFVQYTLSDVSRFREVTLRPVSPDAIWVDMPTGKRFKVGEILDRPDQRNWTTAFPDYQEQVTNLVGNESYLVVERRAIGTHKGPLMAGNQWIDPTSRVFEIETSDVVKIEDGQITSIQHYYDMISVLRRLGMMPDIPLGHDEHDATPLPILHASGFLDRTPNMPSFGSWPVPIRQTVSIGSSKTHQAQMNMKNCTNIHEAFVNHTPERFAELIAPNSVWIDVPTGEVLNGAAAAAHHDHGNWQTAFPDSSAEVLNLIGNDDWVCVQHRGFGTHLGRLQLGGRVYEPTGRKVEIQVLDMVQYQDGKAILIRNYYDMAMMLLQLGIIPG